jgi:glucose-1-phosphate thymidylyltransferase
MEKEEYQLTNALENMKAKGTRFVPGKVSEWLDCGNKDATVHTNQRVLEYDKDKSNLRGKNVQLHNSLVIEPCFIGDDVVIRHSIVGPHVSVGKGSNIENSLVKNSILQGAVKVLNVAISNSMLGEGSEVKGKTLDISISDYTNIVV